MWNEHLKHGPIEHQEQRATFEEMEKKIKKHEEQFVYVATEKVFVKASAKDLESNHEEVR